MIVALLAATLASQPIANEVALDHLMAGQDDAAITVINRQPETDDPARLINLGVAYARTGDTARARAMFRAAHNAPERVDLETASGEWVYSRVLARRAIAMLDRGEFTRVETLALR
jgi:hypothetical protein